MIKGKIQSGKTYLGIELGSTRIKACLIDDTNTPIVSGGYEWENKLENGYWTYSLEEIHIGVKGCFADLSKNISEEYGVTLTSVGAMGISAMMHGYLAFDKDGNLLAPFRTWRNTTTEHAASELSALFGFNVPQRWSISHLYQAILNGEEHTSKIAHITTLSGYIHYLLTGRYELGIGDASGMFPIKDGDYDSDMLDKFDKLIEAKGFDWNIREILPTVKNAGEKGASLTEDGAKFLDEAGNFKAGIPMCPPEGDAGTGMVATNAVLKRTGNVSAGTSIFAMIVLSNPLKSYYPEIDVVTTPDGSPVAMVHCNNCCSEIDAWVNMFGEFAKLSGNEMSKSELYELLYKNALSGDSDCGGITAYNYLSGEHITGVEKGNPMYFRSSASNMTLANFIRAELYSTMASLRIGMDILFDKENVAVDMLQAHGGLFKVKGVAQQILADALGADVSVMETAGEGGACGMALLAAYMQNGSEKSLGGWLADEVFGGMDTCTLKPTECGQKGFDEYMKSYKAGLDAERELDRI